MANLVTKIIQGPGNGTLTIPAGVTQVQINARQRKPGGYQQMSMGIVDPFGNAYAWGQNSNGQLGVGNSVSQTIPTLVLGGFSWLAVTNDPSNQNSTYGIANNGNAYAWGQNVVGNIGDGTIVSKSSPILVLGGFRWKKLFPCNNAVIGIATTGNAYGWGKNDGAQLGIGTLLATSSPVAVLGGLTFADIQPLFVGGTGCCFGLTNVGTAYGWGFNGAGGLGLGDSVTRSSPVLVLGGLTFKQVAPYTDNNNGSCVALTIAGAAYAWGYNVLGQLGLGDVVSRSSPVAVLGGLTFVKLFTPFRTSASVFGLTAAGVLYAWGQNEAGQLGVGDVIPRSSPVAVLGGLTFAKVCGGDRVLGESSVVALTTAGVAYAWGINLDGQLGVGDRTARSSPVAVLGGFTWNDIVSGESNNTWFEGITTTGLVYSWGYNGFGNLGNGNSLSQSSPVLVLGGLAANVVDTITQNTIPVVPGTTYTIAFGPYQATFGIVPIGYNIDQVTISFQQ